MYANATLLDKHEFLFCSIRGIVFVSHGVGEYSGRYKILADSLNARGFCVAAHDHGQFSVSCISDIM